MGEGFVVMQSNDVDIYYYQDEPGTRIHLSLYYNLHFNFALILTHTTSQLCDCQTIVLPSYSLTETVKNRLSFDIDRQIDIGNSNE